MTGRIKSFEGGGRGYRPGTLLTPQAVDGKALKFHQRDVFRGGLQVELQAVRVQLPPVPSQPRLVQPRSGAGELHVPRWRAWGRHGRSATKEAAPGEGGGRRPPPALGSDSGRRHRAAPGLRLAPCWRDQDPRSHGNWPRPPTRRRGPNLPPRARREPQLPAHRRPRPLPPGAPPAPRLPRGDWLGTAVRAECQWEVPTTSMAAPDTGERAAAAAAAASLAPEEARRCLAHRTQVRTLTACVSLSAFSDRFWYAVTSFPSVRGFHRWRSLERPTAQWNALTLFFLRPLSFWGAHGWPVGVALSVWQLWMSVQSGAPGGWAACGTVTLPPKGPPEVSPRGTRWLSSGLVQLLVFIRRPLLSPVHVSGSSIGQILPSSRAPNPASWYPWVSWCR